MVAPAPDSGLKNEPDYSILKRRIQDAGLLDKNPGYYALSITTNLVVWFFCLILVFTVGAVWAVDWNNERRTVVNLQGEIGHRLDDRWRLFVQPGAGVVGRDTPLGLDWSVQAGVRWMFSGSLFAERLLESLPLGEPPKD